MPDAVSSLFGDGTGLFGMGGTGFTTKGLTGAVGDFAGMFGSFSAATGYKDEASLYGMGAAGAEGQEQAAEEIGQVEKFQLNRKIGLTESTQRAAVASNGLEEAGSAADLIRESKMQGNEAQGNLMYSTALKVDQYQQQAAAAQAQEKAANDAAGGAVFGGLLKGVGAIASLAGMF